MGDKFLKLGVSENDFVLSSHFTSGFAGYNIIGGKWFSFRIVRTLLHGQKPFGSLESSYMTSSSPPPSAPLPWKFLGSSHQAARPPAVRRTHSFLHLFLGVLHHLIPSTGYTNSVAHWTSEKVVSAWFSYLDIVGCDSWREWSSLLQLSLLPVANLYTWIILSGSFWQEVVQLADYWVS